MDGKDRSSGTRQEVKRTFLFGVSLEDIRLMKRVISTLQRIRRSCNSLRAPLTVRKFRVVYRENLVPTCT